MGILSSYRNKLPFCDALYRQKEGSRLSLSLESCGVGWDRGGVSLKEPTLLFICMSEAQPGISLKGAGDDFRSGSNIPIGVAAEVDLFFPGSL